MKMNASVEKYRILIVDDDADILAILKINLEKRGYEIFTVSDGSEAISFCQKNTLHLVLLDMILPGITGNQVCRILKTNEKTKDIPIIFLTGEDDVFNKIEGFGSGAIDYVTKPFDINELMARVSRQLEIYSLYLEKENYLKVISQDMDLARRVQRCIVPQWLPHFEGLQICATYFSAESVGGDYYDIFPIDENKIGFLVVDVSGHGISASFITAMAKMAFKNSLRNYSSLKDIFDRVNQDFNEILKTEHYLTAFMAFYYRDTGLLEYIKAGHVNQLLYRKNGEIEVLEATGFFIGSFEEGNYHSKETLLSEGDRLVLFTDGIVECTNENNEQFGTERLEKLLGENSHHDVPTTLQNILEVQNNFIQNQPRSDDYTLLVVEVQKKSFLHDVLEWMGKKCSSDYKEISFLSPFKFSIEIMSLVEQISMKHLNTEEMRKIKIALNILLNASVKCCTLRGDILHLAWVTKPKEFSCVLYKTTQGKMGASKKSLFEVLQKDSAQSFEIVKKYFPTQKFHHLHDAVYLNYARKF